ELKADRLLAENVEAEEDIQYPAEKIIYRVRSGDALGSIAQRYNTTVANLKKWNSLNSHIIKVGQNLSIYSNDAALQSSLVSNDNDSDQHPNRPSSKVYTVQPGDSLWLISRKMEGVSIEQLKKLNNLNNNQIKPGQRLIVG